jgi:hypothetical protein
MTDSVWDSLQVPAEPIVAPEQLASRVLEAYSIRTRKRSFLQTWKKTVDVGRYVGVLVRYRGHWS